MIFSWLRDERRKEWLAQPLEPAWERWLRENVWQFSLLDGSQQQRVRDFVCVLFNEKSWEGGSGFEVTDEMRVTIAGQAALLTLGFNEPYYFDRLRTIIVYAGSYQQSPKSHDDLIIGRLQDQMIPRGSMLGESWQGGPIVLAWDVVLRDGRKARRKRSVVLHEFAHHLDSLNGDTTGSPPMNSYQFEKRWYAVIEKEYRRLLQLLKHRQPTVIDSYGATNKEEFFAVSTESFLTTPHQLAAQHPELYEVLTRFYGQDPRQWIRNRGEASQSA